MKIPQIFIPENKKEINPNKTLLTLRLEDLIAENVNGFNCGEKMITKRINHHILQYPFDELGIKIESVGRIAINKYNGHFSSDYNSVVLIEYKTESYLLDDLKGIYGKGKDYFNNRHQGIRLAERFLFKNNILLYSYGDGNFIEKIIKYYKSLGFKHLD